MIHSAMKLIQQGLEDYLQNSAGNVFSSIVSGGDIVKLDNISFADSQGGGVDNTDNHIVMSLVNLQEESTLKNAPHYRLENGRSVYKHPPVNLNLFILFSATSRSNYGTALKYISKVIEFFQKQKKLSLSTTARAVSGLEPPELELLPELCSLTFEQLNHLWGALGGKQVPFVLYKVRLVSIEADRKIGDRPLIQAIQHDFELETDAVGQR